MTDYQAWVKIEVAGYDRKKVETFLTLQHATPSDFLASQALQDVFKENRPVQIPVRYAVESRKCPHCGKPWR